VRVKPSPSDRAREWFDVYTRDLSSDDLQRLFTHDTREAYHFFARTTGEDLLAQLPWWKRIPLRTRQVFIAFTLKLPPARRALYIGALLIALLGIVRLFRGFAVVGVPLGTPFFQVGVPMPIWAHGTLALIVSLVLVNLLILMEVADRLSLKGELEIAREIQLAMLPGGTYTDGDLEICGLTRPANTVGGDFYDVLPRPDGRVVLALGDVAGKGSPAALLMALLLAVLRTLVDEDLDPPALAARLNVQICRHAPASRFITLFYGAYSPLTGLLTYVNAGQNPPFIRRSRGTCDELGSTGVALGMFERSTFGAVTTTIGPGDMLVLYSDGITEAEDSSGQSLEASGLQEIIARHATEPPAEIARQVLKAVEKHTGSPRFHDDLTILILKRRQSNA
jgi:serine phosphatase RsbU (regulator of sigma subunit)